MITLKDLPVIFGIAVSVWIFGVTGWVWLTKQVLGWGGALLSVLATVMMGLSIWHHVDVEVSPTKVTMQLSELQKNISEQGAQLSEISTSLKAASTKPLYVVTAPPDAKTSETYGVLQKAIEAEPALHGAKVMILQPKSDGSSWQFLAPQKQNGSSVPNPSMELPH